MKTNLTFEPEAQEALQIFDRDIILTANAGSGKTSCLVERYLCLIRQGWEPQQIIALTFTEKAAFEMRERILARVQNFEDENDFNHAKLLMQKVEKAFLGNFHQFCYHILQQNPENSSAQAWNILEEASIVLQREQIFQKIFDDKVKSQDTAFSTLIRHFGIHRLQKIVFEFSEILQKDSSLDSQAAIPDFEILEKELLNSLQDIARTVELEFEKQLEAKHFLTFDLLEKKTLQLFRRSLQFPQLDEIAHVLVDEFQDCSPRQIELLKWLQRLPKRPVLFAVGDSKQSIYRFRDVHQKLIEKTQKEIFDRGGIQKTLRRNYRSNAKLVEFFNRYSEKAFAGSSPSLSMLETQEDSWVETLTLHDGNEKLLSADYLDLEAEIVVEKIQQLQKKSLALSQIAVLFRSSNCSLPLIKLLKEQSIPYSIRGGQNLFENQAIFDLENLLFFLAIPQDEIALIGVLRSPLFLISDTSLYWINDQRRQAPLWNFIKMRLYRKTLEKHFPQELKKIEWTLNILEDLIQQSQTRSGSELLHFLLKSIDGIALLSQASQDEATFLDLYQWLYWLEKIEEENECFNLAKTAEILKRLKKHSIYQTPLSDLCQNQDAVQLSTIHAAKGLEFEAVFLFNLYRRPSPQRDWISRHGRELGLKTLEKNQAHESARFKIFKKLEKTEENEENKRLLYVAMTRAKSKLFIFKGPKQNGSLQQILEEHLETPDTTLIQEPV